MGPVRPRRARNQALGQVWHESIRKNVRRRHNPVRYRSLTQHQLTSYPRDGLQDIPSGERRSVSTAGFRHWRIGPQTLVIVHHSDLVLHPIGDYTFAVSHWSS